MLSRIHVATPSFFPTSMSTSTTCPTLLSTGSCSATGCKYSHKAIRCDPCSWIFANNDAYAAHCKGKAHKRAVSGGAPVGAQVFHCAACNRTMLTMSMLTWKAHIKSSRHVFKTKAMSLPSDLEPDVPDDVPGHTHCVVCNMHVPHSQWQQHSSSRAHQRHERFWGYQNALDDAEKDKHGVSVLGDLEWSNRQLRRTVSCFEESGKDTKKNKASFTVACGGVGNELKYNENLPFSVTFRQSFPGRVEDRLELVFEDKNLKKRFVIVRVLSAHVGNRADHAALRPTAPFVSHKRVQRKPEQEVIEGVLPEALRAIPYVGKLPKAGIPANLASVLGSPDTKSVIETIKGTYLPPVFDSKGYGRQFKNLLWVEEHRMELDLGTYDIHGAKLSRQKQYHFLDVPGLAEKRPSVLVGDRILVQHQKTANPGRWYEGGVHVVRQQEVGLRFSGLFRASPADLFSVRFKLSRTPLRRQHQALDAGFSEDRVLFPVAAHLPDTPIPTTRDTRIKVAIPLIASNPAQLQAIVSILKMPPGSVPFIVFGPPGTGKTVTIVEAMRQVLSANPNARILACAPSNSAADLIAERLVSLGRDVLFRLYAPSRPVDTSALLEFTHVTADGHFGVPSVETMKKFRIVVTTCVSASVVSGTGIPRGHYSHIFVDEAGQATEPQSNIAILTMADRKTNIVLSGDPKQLGPIIHSRIACELGLETSFIERLMQREIYDEQAGYGKTVVKLTKNFRSHPAILQFPNEQFYRGELQPHVDRSITELFVDSPLLPERGFPIIFHAVSGKDDREASSPSFFNIDEASLVRKYVEVLRGDMQHGIRTGVRIADEDIGIIAPYHAQCKKIRTLLRPIAPQVKVGSVEEFQGQERKVIIVSTVRSSREFVNYDLRHTLGFVANPRRFNVAVTRAQSLLIVVGDPNVLGLDPLWRVFLNYAYLSGGWEGDELPWDPMLDVDPAAGDAYAEQARANAAGDMNDLMRRLEELAVAGMEEDGELLS
uniref:RNA helicase n=1 Tax=Mycena chlorophos TaxID=658473 RepID=A0ABQ0LCL9_MYCCL|nr:RNA helicase [Mycena chlorophos]